MINLKKILSCAIMVLCIVSLVSCIDLEDLETSGYCGADETGDNLEWELDKEGTLTISGEGKMKSYDRYIYPATWTSKYNIDNIKKVIIEDGVTTIGSNSFYECSNITEIVIPDSVTEIECCAFTGCSSLQEVTIPDNIKTISEGTFGGCISLKEIVIPDGVKTIEESAFASCEGLTEINIPDGVETISEFAFSGCTNLKKVTIPETVKICGKGAFKNTKFFEDNTGKDKPLIINNMVVDGTGCTGKIIIPDGVTEIGKDAFALTEYNAEESVSSVVLPDSIRIIRNGAFKYCKHLEDINFPEGLKVIESSAFAGCGDMFFIAFLPESLEEIHSLGYNVTSIVVLNPDLDISFFHIDNRPDWAKIYCPRGSKAQEYAEEKGYECILLEEMQDVNEFLISNLYDFEY